MKRTIVHVLAMLASIALLLGGTITAASATIVNPVVHKSYVCKYVGQPGVDERLQTGGNPIWVDNHSLTGKDNSLVKVGDTFSDKQGKSVVIVANTDKLNPEPGIDQCPAPVGPPPQVVKGEKGKMTCEGVFSQTTTVTTPYKLVPVFKNDKIVDYQWVLDTKNAVTVVGDWVFVRALTTQERIRLECPLIEVTPQTPDVTAPTCSADGTLVIPTGPVGVTYQVDPEYNGPGQYTITAVADLGYVLAPAEHDWSWDLTVLPKLTGAQCIPVVTPGPPNPQASIVTVCGHATFTVSNLTPQTTDESATFVTTINGKDSTQVVVKAGDTQTLDYSQTVDVGVVHLGVKSNGVVLASADMQTKCGQGGGTTKPPTTTPVENPVVAPAAAELPHTGGGNALPVALVGLALILLGAPFVWFAYRKAH